MCFMEALLIVCLLDDSAPFDDESHAQAQHNQMLVATRGREPGLQLQRGAESMQLTHWAREIIDRAAAVAALLDAGQKTTCYADAVQAMAALVDDADATPSARIIAELQTSGCSFFDFAMQMSETHKNYFASLSDSSSDRENEHDLQRAAVESLHKQRQIEAADSISFAQYLHNYFAAD